MNNWFPMTNCFPDMFYDQDNNIYYETRGPVASMARREYPAEYPLTKSVPLEWYDFVQNKFTYGPTEENIEDVWNLDGEHFDVENINGILFYKGKPIQKQGTIETSYPAGYADALDFSDEIENGRVLIGNTWYYLTDGLLDRPLDQEVTSGTPYLCHGSIYCFVEVNTQDLEYQFTGTEWTVRPVSYILPSAMGAYADLQGNSWYSPIPYPKKTVVEDTLDPVANGFDMRTDLPRLFYNRYKYRWAGTFPMAHNIDNSIQYGIIRTKPLIARLHYNYRLEVEEW